MSALLGERAAHPTAIVATEDRRGAPVLLPLRYRAPFWEPLLTGVIPAAPLGIGPGDRLDALMALRRPLRLRFLPAMPARNVTWKRSLPEYVLPLAEHPERFWRQNSWMNSIRLNRNRMRNYPRYRDRPEDLRWLLENWRDRWWVTGGEVEIWRERQVLHEHYASIGRAFWTTVADDDGPMAATSWVVIDDVMHFWTTVRRSVHRQPRISPGSHLIERAFCDAHELGLRAVSIGIGFDYKHHWAPAAGLLHECTIAGPLQRVRVAAWKLAGGARHAEAARLRNRPAELTGR